MTQHDYNLANDTGAGFRADINLVLAAIISDNSGATEPTVKFARMTWNDTTLGLKKVRNAANTGWIIRDTQAEAFVLFRSANTVLGAGDYKKTIIATADFTQTFSAATTLGDGWYCYFQVESGATVIFDPNSSETFDGQPTRTVAGQSSGIIFCDGSNFRTIGFAVTTDFGTGDVKLTLKNVADTGWVMCADGTIGDATSGGTARANADTVALFTLLWNNVSNTWAAVSSGRGGSAAADYAAHKTIALTKMLGRALALSGAGSGLTARALGETLGEETHVLITSEMPAHTHTYFRTTGSFVDAGPNVDRAGEFGDVTGSTGGGAAHNNMQPSSFLNAMIKL